MRRTPASSVGFAIASTLVFGCAHSREIVTSGFRHVSLANAGTNDGVWREVEEDLRAGRPVVIDLEAGQSLPVAISAVTPVASLEVESAALRFTKDVHVLVQEGSLMVSPDGTHWAAIQDRRSVGALFGINHGSLQMGLSVSKEKGATAVVDLKAE
jgi:hypothetical protein